MPSVLSICLVLEDFPDRPALERLIERITERLRTECPAETQVAIHATVRPGEDFDLFFPLGQPAGVDSHSSDVLESNLGA